MTKEKRTRSIQKVLSGKLGGKLASRLGKGRLNDIARDIADYKEQVGWQNTPHELNRLKEKIHYVPALVAANLTVLRLSKKSETKVHSALWGTLKRTFPALRLQPR